MAKGFNQCCFIGNLGDEPTIKTTQSGTQVANFSLAVKVQPILQNSMSLTIKNLTR